MEDILQNEIKRQEYMDLRYKNLDEDSTKPDLADDSDDEKEKVEKSEKDKEEQEIKIIEDNFNLQKGSILEELGLWIINSERGKSLFPDFELKFFYSIIIH